MKRFLSFALILCVLLATPILSPAALAEDDEVESFDFKPEYASALDHSASEWFASSTNRALLTVLLSMDMINSEADENVRIDPSKTSYVGMIGIRLVVAGWNNAGDKVTVIIYTPLLETAAYASLELSATYEDSISDLMVEMAMSGTCDTYYKNSESDILSVVMAIAEYLSD